MGTFERYDPLVCVPRSAVKVAAVEQQEDFSPTEAQIELQKMWQTWPTEAWCDDKRVVNQAMAWRNLGGVYCVSRESVLLLSLYIYVNEWTQHTAGD